MIKKTLLLSSLLGVTAPIYEAAAAAPTGYAQTRSDQEFFASRQVQALFCYVGLSDPLPVPTVEFYAMVYKACYKHLAIVFHPDKTVGDEAKQTYFKTLGTVNEFFTSALLATNMRGFINSFLVQNSSLISDKPSAEIMGVVQGILASKMPNIVRIATESYERAQREAAERRDPIALHVVKATHLYAEHSPLSQALQSDLVRVGYQVLSQVSRGDAGAGMSPGEPFFSYLNARHGNALMDLLKEHIYAPTASRLVPSLHVRGFFGAHTTQPMTNHLTAITAALWAMMDMAYAQTKHHYSRGTVAFVDPHGHLFSFFENYTCLGVATNMGWISGSGSDASIEIDARLQTQDGLVSIFPNGFTHATISRRNDMTYIKIAEVGNTNIATLVRGAQIGLTKSIFGVEEPTHRCDEVPPSVMAVYRRIQETRRLEEVSSTPLVAATTVKAMLAGGGADDTSFISELEATKLTNSDIRLGSEVIFTHWGN